MEAKTYTSLTELKLCKKCKYSKTFFNGNMNIYLCTHVESLKEVDPVNGDKFYSKCDVMRQYTIKCGSEAKLFEPKPSLLKRLFK